MLSRLMMLLYGLIDTTYRRLTGRCVPYCNPGRWDRVDSGGSSTVYRCPLCGDTWIW